MHYVLPHDSPDDRGTERWFTNSAAPSEGEVRITTHINNERHSSFKTALAALQPGDEITADGPEGNFVLGDMGRNYLFIAGGIGITPVRSILVEAAAQNLQPHITVLYANRDEHIAFRDELTSLQTKNPNLNIRYAVEPERIDEAALQTTLQDIDDPLVYVSGPKPMVKAMVEQLQALGVSKDNLRSDDFPGYAGI